MKKIRMDCEALCVESFEVAPQPVVMGGWPSLDTDCKVSCYNPCYPPAS